MFYVFPLIPGLIVRWFFDTLTGARQAELNESSLIALLLVATVARAAIYARIFLREGAPMRMLITIGKETKTYSEDSFTSGIAGPCYSGVSDSPTFASPMLRCTMP